MAVEAAPLLAENGGEDVEDYEAVMSVGEMRKVFWNETVKLWKIACPIICTILCNYGVNSFTNIFVGHIGELELSAVSISLNVIGTFSFGFMVSLSLFLSLFC